MSPRISVTPICCTRRNSSHMRSSTSLGSPLPLMTRSPSNTPSFTVPFSQTGVVHVQAGPSSSSAANVVNSFINDAGLTGCSACQANLARREPTSCTITTSDSAGTFARSRAASTSTGKTRGAASNAVCRQASSVSAATLNILFSPMRS